MKKKIILQIALSFICVCSSIKSHGQCSAVITDTIGNGGSVNFYSIVTNPGGGSLHYYWTFGDGDTSSQSNPTHIYEYNYTYNACLMVYHDSIGCFDTLCIQVQVMNALQSLLCPGNAAFTATADGSVTDFTNSSGYWQIVDFGDGSSGSGIASGTISHQYNLNNTYRVTAVAYSYFNGFYLACDTSTQTVIVSNISCHASFEASVDSFGYYLFFENTSLGDTAAQLYINDSLVVSNATYYSADSLRPGTYNVCLVIEGPGGCVDSTCQQFTLNYTGPCLSATFSYVPVAGTCNTYVFTADTTGGGVDSIVWLLNSSLVGSQLQDTITLDFSSSTSIESENVSVFANGQSCESTQTFSFTSPAYFYMYMDTSGSAHTWEAVPIYTSDVKSQVWDFGDGTSSTDAYPNHAYASAGNYNVCHTDTLTNGCVYTYCFNEYLFRTAQGAGMVYFIVVPPLGVQEQTGFGTPKVYPNPTSDLINFNFENAPAEDLSLRMYNSVGMVVKSISLQNGLTTYSLNASDLANGIYFYEITGSKGNVIHGKIIVYR